MPPPFSQTIAGIALEPILDPLALGCSDVSIGQSPSDLVRAMAKKKTVNCRLATKRGPMRRPGAMLA